MKKTLYVKSGKEWRAWLEVNFQREEEIWLVYPRKSSGRERIPYNDAVEEALCFGWIDSTEKRPEEFEKRLANFLDRTRQNRLIKGFGGIDKYY